jgi:hypothetical protein
MIMTYDGAGWCSGDAQVLYFGDVCRAVESEGSLGGTGVGKNVPNSHFNLNLKS